MTKEIEEKVKEFWRENATSLSPDLSATMTIAKFVYSLLTPSSSVQERAKEYADNEQGDSKEEYIFNKHAIKAAYLAGASGNGMQEEVERLRKQVNDLKALVDRLSQNNNTL
jgi:hypothetical protein